MNKKFVSALAIPLVLMSLCGLAYASWSDAITKTYGLTAGTVELAITECTKLYYNGLKEEGLVTFDDGDIIVFDDNIFPYWKLELVLKVENTGSLPIVITGHTVDFTPLWAETYFEMYRGWYWDLDLSDPAIDDMILQHGEFIYLHELLIFDEQAQLTPELQSQSFTIIVTIVADQAV